MELFGFLVEGIGEDEFQFVLEYGKNGWASIRCHPVASEEEAIDSIRELQALDLKTLPIHVREGQTGHTRLVE